MGTGNSDSARGRRPADGQHRRAAAADAAAKWKSFFALVDRLGLKAEPGDPTGAELIRKSREQRLKHLRER